MAHICVCVLCERMFFATTEVSEATPSDTNNVKNVSIFGIEKMGNPSFD